MRRSMTMTVVLGLLVMAACKKGEDKPAAPVATVQAPPTAPPAPPPAASDPVASTGVEPGGIQRDASEGPAAVIAAVTGTVEVRRLGEAQFAAAAADAPLYPGDALRTGDGSTATLAVADESVIEVAEVSTVAIASREGTADPASSAAVLAGLARFTVTPRAPGEGAFRVYTPAGVIVTKGTVYGVGVAASGQVRVGVETGAVDVIGLAAVDAHPVSVEAGAATTLEATGTVASPAPWPQDDWGAWRDDTDAKVEIVTAVDGHARAMAELDAQLTDAYNDLNATAEAIATFEASASASADKGDTAAYQASLPDAAATIDASFSLAGYIEALTWAHAARASLATDLYVRHPDVVAPKWEIVAPRVDAAVLWPKRFEVTAAGYLEPLRGQYYVHHPRGRAHAPVVGVAVPAFYASVAPPALEPAHVRGRIKTKVWVAPDVQFKASPRPVWVAAPAADWRAKLKLKLKPAPMRGGAKVAWYVRPATLKGKVLVGGDVKGAFESKLAVVAPAPRANLRAAWKVPVGARIKLAAPDLAAAASVRAKLKVGPDGFVQVRDHRAAAVDVAGGVPGAAVDAELGGGLKGKVKSKFGVKPVEAKLGGAVAAPGGAADVGVKVRDHRDAAAGVGAGVGVKVRDHRDTAAGVGAGVGVKVRDHRDAAAGAAAGVKVQAPAVKIKAPGVKVKGEVKGEIKGGLKLGN